MREDRGQLVMRLLSIVLPVHGEETNLPKLYSRLTAALDPLAVRYEIIVVDDGSTDSSFGVARQISERDARVKVLRFSRRFGHQTALCAGIDHAEGDAIVMMDSDLQHPPELIPELLKKYEEGYEIVYTIRTETEKEGPLKRMTSSLFYRLFCRVTSVNLQAGTADFRLMGRRATDALKQFRERHLFLRGIIGSIGFRQASVSYHAGPRMSGRSKYNFRGMLSLAFDALFSFSHFPMRLAVAIGLLFNFLALIYAGYILDYHFTRPDAVPGWSSVMLVMLFVSGLLLLTLGVLGEYVTRVYEEVKRRPLYIIEEAVGFGRLYDTNRKANVGFGG